MNIKYKTILFLILLCIVDFMIPLPILGMMLIYVVLKRPPGFMELADRIYRER